MDEVTQERIIFALTRAIGPRFRYFSPVTLAVALEDLCLREAATRCGIPRDVLTSRPPALLRRRPGLIPTYHAVAEGLLAALSVPELNPAEWWAELNRGVGVGGAAAPAAPVAAPSAGGGGGAGSALPDATVAAVAAAFFEHYRPQGESWASAAERSGGMAKYSAKRALGGGGGDMPPPPPPPCFDFPTPALPHTLDEYLTVYCGTGLLGAAVARSALHSLRVGKGVEAEALLPSLPALRAAQSEHAASEQLEAGRRAAAAAAAAAPGRGRGGLRGGRGRGPAGVKRAKL
jgi:hypothetical protein